MNPGTRPTLKNGPLHGLRILDFTWWVVGPWAPRLLANLGAEVIKVERTDTFDGMRNGASPGRRPREGKPIPQSSPNQSGSFNTFNADKLAITLNMRHPEGKALAERLIRMSDAVVENFSAGVMDSWGLGWEELHQINTALVYVAISGWGHSGEWSGYRSYGPTAQAVSGLSHTSGLPDRQFGGWGFSYMDVQGGFVGGMALASALYHAKRTGQGSFVDYCIIEAAMSMLGPILLDFDVNGRTTRRPGFPPGNRSLFPALAPHNTYRCTGRDRVDQDVWCFIACESDAQFEALAQEMGQPGLLTDPRFITNAARVEHQDALDSIIQVWTETQPRYVVMDRLQRVGVIAAAVQNGEDRVEHDPQLRHREVYPVLDHPEVGAYPYEGYPPKLSRTPVHPRRAAPMYREHNAYVFGELLGLAPAEIERLTNEGVI